MIKIYYFIILTNPKILKIRGKKNFNSSAIFFFKLLMKIFLFTKINLRFINFDNQKKVKYSAYFFYQFYSIKII